MFNTPRAVVLTTTLLGLLSLYSTEALAVTGTEIINPLKEFLIDNVVKNVGVIGALSAVVVGVVAALGQQVGKFVLNNLGYVGYVAFGSTLSIGALTAAGMTF